MSRPIVATPETIRDAVRRDERAIGGLGSHLLGCGFGALLGLIVGALATWGILEVIR